MDYENWSKKAWDDHADDATGVAARLHEGLALATDAGRLEGWARLAHHVHANHLGDWAGGRAALARAAAQGHAEAALPLLRTLDAALVLASGAGDPRSGLAPADAVRATALAAGDLAARDVARAGALLREAVAAADGAALPGDAPAARTLAATGNNIACELEERDSRSDAERELMILAAQTARVWWERAGTWLETERAEYRLAQTWLKAGEPSRARSHAEACLAIVREHDAPALEHFFAWEAIGHVARAASDAPALVAALAEVEAAFGRLDAGDQGWCRESLDRLRASVNAAA